MSYLDNKPAIPGTILFDGKMARQGYGLNKMCFSFNDQSARDVFLADEVAYCKIYALSDSQIKAIAERDVLALLNLGGNIYYLAKFVGMLGMNMQDIGAMQTGLTVAEFKEKLVRAGD